MEHYEILTGLDHRNDASVQAWLRHDGQFATDTQALATSGTYTILINPRGSSTGSLALRL